MNSMLQLAILMLPVRGDLRLNFEQDGADARNMSYRIPSTFGYGGLVDQKNKDNDQFLRSNIDNEANRRNLADEPAQDMLPFRQMAKGKIMTFQRGVPITLPLRWNNPHDADCEVNIWTNGMTSVAPIKRPFNCGGGYQDQRFSTTIPLDFPGCKTPEDNCVMQLYAHSVEPRTYAIGIDFVLTGEAAVLTATPTQPIPTQNPTGDALPNTKDIPFTQFQQPILYNDAFDSSHVDSSYSFYRGQQKAFIRDNVLAACQLQSYVGNGGLIPLGNIDSEKAKQMRDKIQEAIREAEAKAIEKNKAAQESLDKSSNGQSKKCYEGELYGVVNNKDCNRQYTNTYVTNVDYRAIYNNFLPELMASGLTPYSPRLKNTPGITPVDPYGSYKVNDKPSAVSKNEDPKTGYELATPPPKGQQIPPPRLGKIKPIGPISPPLEADFYTGPEEQGATGKGKDGFPGQKAPQNGQALNTDKQAITTFTTIPVYATYSMPKVEAPTSSPSTPILTLKVAAPATSLPAMATQTASPLIMVPGYLPVASPAQESEHESHHHNSASATPVAPMGLNPTTTSPNQPVIVTDEECADEAGPQTENDYTGPTNNNSARNQDSVNQRQPSSVEQSIPGLVGITMILPTITLSNDAEPSLTQAASISGNPSVSFTSMTPQESYAVYNAGRSSSISVGIVIAISLALFF